MPIRERRTPIWKTTERELTTEPETEFLKTVKEILVKMMANQDILMARIDANHEKMMAESRAWREQIQASYVRDIWTSKKHSNPQFIKLMPMHLSLIDPFCFFHGELIVTELVKNNLSLHGT
jgi:hypothetical protein